MFRKIYRQEEGKLVAGVLAGMAHRFHLDVWKVRGVFLLLCLVPFLFRVTIAIYILLALLLPYRKADVFKNDGSGPRRRKDAEKI